MASPHAHGFRTPLKAAVFPRIGWHSFGTSSLSFRIAATSSGLYALDFEKAPRSIRKEKILPRRTHLLLKRTEFLLKEYLAGRKANFRKLPVDWSGYKKFERRVLEELRKIPQGQIETYQSLAKRSGRLRAARYVGKILGSNRIPVILPCHRIVPKSGGLGGFSRGVRWKKWLLKLEEACVDTKNRM